MSAVHTLILSLGMLLPAGQGASAPANDPARWREVLFDRQHPRQQSQAALLLLQTPSLDAEEIIRQGLRQTNAPEVFTALASSIRLTRDRRFVEELFAALTGGLPALRQATSDTLAVLADSSLVARLQALVEDSRADRAVRQAALTILGRTGRKEAVGVLLDHLAGKDDQFRQASADGLMELTGRAYGSDVARWRSWWQAHQGMSNEQWLEERLAYQSGRTRRFESDLERARAQIVSLHQQLYSRLPAGDRQSHVQTLAEADDPAVRTLAVIWCVELMPTADAVGQRALAELLYRFTFDGTLDVQRPAVLALGRINDAKAFDRLSVLLQQGDPTVRAAAARSLALQARAPGPEAPARQRQVVPALQRALDDPALEVVVEAAESLGTLGVSEAGPVLSALLRHPSTPVRQTAALALERVADATILGGLLEALDDTAVTVRFSLVGALGHAVGDGRGISDTQKARLLSRLEGLLIRDADPGVRSRAATVIGECGPPAMLTTLWRRVLATEDSRVQEKAWAAMIEILVRSASLDLLREWNRLLVDTNQPVRRTQLLAEAASRWLQKEETRNISMAVQELLIDAHLQQGKWTAALPLVRDLLSKSGSEGELEKRLLWLLAVGEQALKEGNRQETQRVVQEARTYLGRRPNLAVAFDNLEKQAKQ